MKIDRLISIIVLLLRKERVQARELAELFGVSVRTIYRDIEAINLAGIPLVTYQGVNGGISIVEGYRLDRSVLSGDDMASLIAMLRGYAAVVPGDSHTVLLEKLKNVLTQSQLEALNLKVNQLVIDPSPWGGYGPVKERIAIIRKAIAETCRIEFIYTDAAGRKTRRRVEPYSLILKSHHWYLYAWCLMRQNYRLFKLLRLKEPVLTGERFQAREMPLDQSLWENEWHDPGQMIEMELAFDPDMEPVVEEWFGEENMTSANGRILVRMTLPENDWLYGYLLSFGKGVEIINPPHIREIIARQAREIYLRYHSENMT